MFGKNKQIFHLHWNGIDIEIGYDPSWSPAYFENYEEALAHLECRAVAPEKARLPITETGYRSHFTPASAIEDEGGPVAYLQAWLDHAAQSREWQGYLDAQRQPMLFDM